ncbi:protein lifeguard 1-like [Argonauta hians]
MPDEDLGSSNYDFEFSDISIRMGFIRKVYSILMLQLLVTLGIIVGLLFVPGFNQFAKENKWLLFVTLVATLVTMILLSCCSNLRREFPVNFIMLTIFTLCEGFLLGFISSFYETFVVIIAVGVTAIVSASLTVFAFQTKWNFTTMGGMLFVFLIILLVFGILCIFLWFTILSLVYSCLGALLFSFYLVFDTQLMLRGKHQYSLSPEEYVFAALNLYVDIVQIFLFILGIMRHADD